MVISHLKNFRFLSGFTMIETLVAIMLVGIAVVSLIAASGSLTRINAAGAELSTAEFLIEQIRELTDLLPVIDPQTGTFGHEEGSLDNYDDIDDFDGISFNPPITSDRQPLTDLNGYSQQVTVVNVSQSNFQTIVADGSSNFMRVTVKVFLNGNEISSGSWLRTKY